MLYELLVGYGYDVMACNSVTQALAYLESECFDCIITDQVMPQMSGWDLLRITREHWPKIPVILYSSMPPIESASVLSFDAELIKPISSELLLDSLNKVLARR